MIIGLAGSARLVEMHTRKVLAIPSGSSGCTVIHDPQGFWESQAREQSIYPFPLLRGAGLRRPLFDFLAQNAAGVGRLETARIEIDLGWPELHIFTRERQLSRGLTTDKSAGQDRFGGIRFSRVVGFYMQAADTPPETSKIHDRLALCLARAGSTGQNTPDFNGISRRHPCPA
jgi:hypothetical protein